MRTKQAIPYILMLLLGILIGSLVSFFWRDRVTNIPESKIVQVSEIQPIPIKAKAEPVVTCEARKYTVKAGDYLLRIAGQAYGGRSYLYLLIAESNGIKNPNLIYPNQVLSIPSCLSGLPVISVKPTSYVRSVRNTKIVKVKSPIVAVEPVIKTVLENRIETVVPPSISVIPVSVVDAPVSIVQLVVETASISKSSTISATAEASKPQALNLMLPTEAVKNSAKIETDNFQPINIASVRIAPGSMWNSFGTTPIESGNRIDYFHVDQGLVLGQFKGRVQAVPYLALNVTKDTEGFSWNNKAKAEAGLKLIKPFSRGVIEAGGAYATERREEIGGSPSEIRSGFIGYTDGWFGWDEPSRSSRKSFLSAMPGNGQWIIGNISPFEGNNIIGTARLEQGITVAKIGSVSIISLGWGQAGFDTQNNSWNNRYTYGGGLRVSVPWTDGVISTQGGYECVKPHGGGSIASIGSMCGPMVKLDFWTGWRKKMGGR